jgi:hypothetical protein
VGPRGMLKGKARQVVLTYQSMIVLTFGLTLNFKPVKKCFKSTHIHGGGQVCDALHV